MTTQTVKCGALEEIRSNNVRDAAIWVIGETLNPSHEPARTGQPRWLRGRATRAVRSSEPGGPITIERGGLLDEYRE